MGSLLNLADGEGIFDTMNKGYTNLNNTELPILAKFVGILAVFAGVIFLVVAVMKTRDKIKWFWYAGAAFLIGAALIFGAAPMMTNSAGNTWKEVFGGSDVVFSNLRLLLHV